MKFDEGFEFGVSTISYQIEGSPESKTIWDDFCAWDNATVDNKDAKVTCDHYHHIEEDVRLLTELGIDSYHFSISWSRIFPKRGKYNEKGMEWYKNLCIKLTEAGIKPVITLFHWDLPAWCQELGGFSSRSVLEHFLQYCHKCFENLYEYAERFITIASPANFTLLGHLFGSHAPGIKNANTALEVMHHILLSHGAAVKLYKKLGKTKPIGINLGIVPAYAASESYADNLAAEFYDGFVNRLFLEPLFNGQYPNDILNMMSLVSSTDFSFIEPSDMGMIYNSCDFVELSYDKRCKIKYNTEHPLRFHKILSKEDKSITKWATDLEGFVDAIEILRDYTPLPLYISVTSRNKLKTPVSNGIKDAKRTDYIAGLINRISSIYKEQKIQGFSYRSFLDCFEWEHGYTSQSGLVQVDFDTQERIPKESYYAYQKFLKTKETK